MLHCILVVMLYYVMLCRVMLCFFLPALLLLPAQADKSYITDHSLDFAHPFHFGQICIWRLPIPSAFECRNVHMRMRCVNKKYAMAMSMLLPCYQCQCQCQCHCTLHIAHCQICISISPIFLLPCTYNASL